MPQKKITWPLLKRKYRSDLVVWAQQHLMSLGLLNVVNGNFGAGTQTAVTTFQVQQGLPLNGQVDTATWARLLAVANPAKVKWSAKKRSAVKCCRRRRHPTFATPLNAKRPAVRDELRGKPGR